MMHEEEIFQK